MITKEQAIKLRAIIEKVIQALEGKEAIEATCLFPNWAEGVEYAANTKVRYNNILYKVLIAHTSQTTWMPDVAPSLFAKVLTSETGDALEWVQPDSTNPYMKGDKVLYNGKIYQSIIDNNVSAPDVYGWEEVNG